ncbi:uncharacterized protein LOC105190499 [Harpegnathos saltator]|uniref:uncharacterized protein LOC105190499 n=1 Tax=Harpegnathos saltator TaxID=610380 RepID=UPI00058F11DB|nr:uncharacterized protein LOC105190499 [Harpegnathos saltator]
MTDNGTEFVNNDIAAFARDHGIEHTTTPPYHPQANPVERVNRVLKTMVVAFIEQDHREWDRRLKDFRFAYNAAHHSSLGMSPAFLNLGRELEPTVSLRRRREGRKDLDPGNSVNWSERRKKLAPLVDWVRENLAQAYERQAGRYNLRKRPAIFGVGDFVWKKQHVLSSAANYIAAKLAPKYSGPFVVTARRSSAVYELADEPGKPIGKVHAKDLKQYVPPL